MNQGIDRIGFFLDARSCSGCKACQVACKDQNGLEVGRLWRRVYEVSGGEWQRMGDAWKPDIFAYNLSVSCNHCEAPICAEVCPTRAITWRSDGIVMLDSGRCIGCGYCGWACPYGALQYDEANGQMSKCDFCAGEIDAGRPPACVAACPMRVLEFGPMIDLQARAVQANGSYPLPDPALTSPSLIVIPHKDSSRPKTTPAKVSPLHQQALDPWPLISFTLLTQTAVGALTALGILRLIIGGMGEAGVADLLSDLVLPIGTLLIILAAAASIRHLGKPTGAYRALANMRSSWLSREVGLAGFMAAGTVVLTSLTWFDLGSFPLRSGLLWLLILAGCSLIYCMSRVYMLRTVSVWNTRLTPLSFFTSSLLLGMTITSATFLILGAYSSAASSQMIQSDLDAIWPGLAVGLAVVVVLRAWLETRWAARSNMAEEFTGGDDKPRQETAFSSLRWTLLLPGGLLMISLLFAFTSGTESPPFLLALSLLALAVTFGGELVGRHQFFKQYRRIGI